MVFLLQLMFCEWLLLRLMIHDGSCIMNVGFCEFMLRLYLGISGGAIICGLIRFLMSTSFYSFRLVMASCSSLIRSFSMISCPWNRWSLALIIIIWVKVIDISDDGFIHIFARTWNVVLSPFSLVIIGLILDLNVCILLGILSVLYPHEKLSYGTVVGILIEFQ